MNLDPSFYKSQSAPGFAADPFFQEWVFHPLGENHLFWLDMLISHSEISMQMQIAQGSLLQYAIECPFITVAIDEYTKMKTNLAGETSSELCFSITMDYWTTLKQRLILYEFERSEYEIQFFKVIKPLFTGKKEFYSFLHHADLFSGSAGDKGFWRRQTPRLEKFKIEHKDFYTLYSTGKTRYDEWWYRRSQSRDQTSHDGLVASYLGMVRYLQYVNQKLYGKGDQ